MLPPVLKVYRLANAPIIRIPATYSASPREPVQANVLGATVGTLQGAFRFHNDGK